MPRFPNRRLSAFSDRTKFSLQRTHAEFKPDIGHDPFQHVSDEGPNDRQEEETADDGDELQGVDSDEDESVSADEDASEGEGENGEQDKDEDQADVNIELNHDDTDDLLPEEIEENPGRSAASRKRRPSTLNVGADVGRLLPT